MTKKEREALIDQLLEARQEELEGKKCRELFREEEWKAMREERRQDTLRRYREKLEEKDDDWLFGFSEGYEEIAGEAIEAKLEAYQCQLDGMGDDELKELVARLTNESEADAFEKLERADGKLWKAVFAYLDALSQYEETTDVDELRRNNRAATPDIIISKTAIEAWAEKNRLTCE